MLYALLTFSSCNIIVLSSSIAKQPQSLSSATWLAVSMIRSNSSLHNEQCEVRQMVTDAGAAPSCP